MSASPVHRQKQCHQVRNRVVAISETLEYRDSGVCHVFVALPFLSSTHGKNPETRESIPSGKLQRLKLLIDNFNFSPPTIIAPVGATVTWTNHAITRGPYGDERRQSVQKSPVLKAGSASSNTFATAGTYSYFCSIHHRMTGKIIVNVTPTTSDNMKSLLSSSFWKTAQLIIPLSLIIG